MPFIERVAENLYLGLQQIDIVVESKTSDNVFVSVPISVQYRVAEGQETEAFYALDDYEQQITSLVQDTTRTALSALVLDAAFASKDQIASAVDEALRDQMLGYGWQIVNSLVTDIKPAKEVADAMNQINSAQRQRAAAVELAEAEKIRMVKEAEGRAEARRLAGVGMANERKEIVDGLAAQIKTLTDAGVNGGAEELLMMSQYFDTLAKIGEANAKVLFMPSDPAGLNTIKTQMQQAIISSTEATK